MAAATAGARWAKARLLCPPEEYGSPEWLGYYQDNPDVLMQILGDLYRIYKSEEKKKNGTANPQGGRRKSHIEGSLDDLWAIMTPKFSTDAFPVAFKALLGTRSLRQFALKSGIDHRDLSRKQKRPDMLTRYDLERVAKALDVHPAYFIEWRAMVVQELISHLFVSSPHLSISLLKALSR